MPTISAMDPGLRYDDQDQEAAQARARNQDFMMRQYLQNQQLAMQQGGQNQAIAAQERMHAGDLADRGLGRQAEFGLQDMRGHQNIDLARVQQEPQMGELAFQQRKYGDQRSDTAPQRELGNTLDSMILNKIRGSANFGSNGSMSNVTPQGSGSPAMGAPGASAMGATDPEFLNQIVAGRYGVAYKSPEQRMLEAQIMRNKLGAAQNPVSGGDSFAPVTLAGRATYQKVLQATGDVGQAQLAAQQAEQGEAQAEQGDLASGNAAALSRFTRKDTAFSPTQKAAVGGGVGLTGGAALGAGIGSLFGGVGAVPGAIIGGGLGLLAGGTSGALTGEEDPTDADTAQIAQSVKQEAATLARARGIPLPQAMASTKMKYRQMLIDAADKIGADKTRQLMAAIEGM